MRGVHLTGVSGLGPFRRFCDDAGDGVFSVALRRAGVPESLVERPEAMMPLPAMYALFREAARLTGDDLFGLHVGQAMHPSDFGVWVNYTLAGGTLGDAIRRSMRMVGYHQPGARFSLVARGNDIVWRFHGAADDLTGHTAHADHVLWPMLNTVRLFAGRDWLPQAFYVPYARPAHAGRLEARLEAPMVFAGGGTGLAFGRGLLALPGPPRGDGGSVALGEIRRLLVRRRIRSVADAVESMLTFGPDRIGCDLAAVARLMGRSSRALQKDLQREGTTFREVVSRARLAEARFLIRGTSLPLSEIAWRLGYSELPHFSRAFSRAVGMAPSRFRTAEAATGEWRDT